LIKPQFPSDGREEDPGHRPAAKSVGGRPRQMSDRLPHRALLRLGLPALVALLALLAVPAFAGATKKGKEPTAQPPAETTTGSLEQLPGRLGCLSSGKAAKKACGQARALKGAGPGVGSRAIAVSPDGRNVYVAASGSDSIAVFDRNPVTGALTQPKGKAGCVASLVGKAKGDHCGLAAGLIGPNSVAVSPDGRNVYATSRSGSSVTAFIRNRRTGELRQLPPSASGCISGLPIPTCTTGRGLKWPDVVVVSPDGKNVYVGDFAGSGVISFSRAGKAGALTQLSATAGCITEAAAEGCAQGRQMNHIEGMAINPGGTTVYAASPFSNAIDILRRSTTGALTQAPNRTGCITNEVVSGCAQGYEFDGVNALVVSPKGGNVYATSLTSNSVATFSPTKAGGLAQAARPEGENVPEGISNPEGCLVYLRAPGCSFGRAMKAPEGLALSPTGTNLYIAAFETGAIDVLDRNQETGVVEQKPGERGCLAPPTVGGCGPGRALSLTGSVVVSPDGRNVYSTAQKSDAVDIFRRIR
jgi:DNA-binding beta-propeller fold protein YncE